MEATDASSGSAAGAKRRRLAAAPPGNGPPANPVTAVLYNPTLLARVWALRENVPEAQSRFLIFRRRCTSPEAFRLVSKDARAAFDPACEAPLVYGPERRGDSDFGPRLCGGPSPATVLAWVSGMLQRGRRPREVRIWVDAESDPDEWQQGALGLLRAIPQLSGRPGEGVASVASLDLPAQLLSPSTAPLIAGAFPNLSPLVMTAAGELSPNASNGAAQGLAMLLGAASGAEGSGAASAGAGGEGTGGGEEAGVAPSGAKGGGASAGPSRTEGASYSSTHNTGPLLHSLAELSVEGLRHMPPGLASVLGQLRTLDLKDLGLSDGGEEGQDGAGGGPAQELAALTQLTALSLSSCAVPLLPVLTGALTRLTSLQLSHQREDAPLSPALFAPLQGLQRLEIPSASLEVAELAEALSSLTRLSVGGFTLPAQQLSQPLTIIPRWRLPAGLRELGLGTYTSPPPMVPEVLAGLEVHTALRLDRGSSANDFLLTPGRHTAAPIEEGGFAGTALLPAAEEALCGALRFVQAHRLLLHDDLEISYEAEGPHQLLQPDGGTAGAGPGRPNHGRWLREVAALGPIQLTLRGIKVSYQDVRMIRDSLTSLEGALFMPPCEISLPALPLLAGLPALDLVVVDATPWAGDDPESTELRGRAMASLLALAHAWPSGRDRELDLQYPRDLDPAARQRVRQLGLRILEQMEACEMGSMLITAAELTVEVDPDEED
ncbi:hypothetical protein HYH03_001141 [Edaphochlamys debaryana]|uniref:Uncharacterized protein n=1 Tax=Edaphochlamys debaryana TaxID=47281 RepID=A0A835YI27_9CHLO|nr:hypothetical protein HYH03_001141 [Edaphochlamys debaryana]|eukprot:KAG2501351.1 hypothetical protein HYH03_001141 [Edaphochlamys debaryana]